MSDQEGASFLDRLIRFKPLTELFTSIGGLFVSFAALSISIYAVYASSSSPDFSVHLGRHFGLAILRGNHLEQWDLPEFNYPEENRILVLDFAVVISNGGGRRGVIDHMVARVVQKSSGDSVSLEWKLFFIEPTNRDLKKRPELVTPIVVEGNSSQTKLVRFSSRAASSLPPEFFGEGEEYTITLAIHDANSGDPISELTDAYWLDWDCDDHCFHNVGANSYSPSQQPGSGETALLTLY